MTSRVETDDQIDLFGARNVGAVVPCVAGADQTEAIRVMVDNGLAATQITSTASAFWEKGARDVRKVIPRHDVSQRLAARVQRPVAQYRAGCARGGHNN